MVKTRKSARVQVLQLDASPEKNGYDDKRTNGVDVEMEVDNVPKKLNNVEKSPKIVDKSPKITMKAKLEKEGLAQKEPEKAKEKPSTGSMAVLLTQGLMANDAEKVDTALRESNLDSIQATLRDLNVVHVIPLLKAIEHRLRTRRAIEIRPWLRWLQCTMSYHMSFLSSQRGLDKEMGGLLEWMRSRAVHMQKLFELHGKLGVLVDQIERRSNNTVPLAPQPLIMFNNDELVDSDMDDIESLGEDEGGASSEEDWWDEGDIREAKQSYGDDEDDEEDDEDEELEDFDDFRPKATSTVRSSSGSDDEEDDDEDDEMEED